MAEAARFSCTTHTKTGMSTWGAGQQTQALLSNPYSARTKCSLAEFTPADT